MKMQKKLLRKSLCIALAAVTLGGFAAVAAPVLTDSGIVAEAAFSTNLNYKDYKYKIVNDDYAVITEYAGRDKNLVIPESIHDFKIIGIAGGAFTGNQVIETVEIPEGVMEIGNGAFYKCDNLASVSIPSTVESIGYKAFAETSLTSVEIPESVKKIGVSAFNSCYLLREATINAEVDEIPMFAFNNCASLEKIDLPYSVQKIGFQAFGHCSALESVDIPEDVVSIGDRAFVGCSSLSEVNLNDNLQSIGLEAFYSCSKLMSVEVPKNVQKIGLMAFGYSYNGAVKKFIPHPDFKMTVYLDSAGQAYAVKNGFQFETLYEPLQNDSTTEKSEYNLGEEIVIKGAASGGSGEYTYSYYFKRSANKNWKLIGEENTTETTASFTPKADAFYDVKVVVTDSNGESSELEMFICPNKKFMENDSYLASSKVALGKNVKIYGKAMCSYIADEGEEMPEAMTYTYYFRRSGNTAWKMIGTEDTNSDSASFKPSAAGTYEVKVVTKFGTLSDEKILTATVE